MSTVYPSALDSFVTKVDNIDSVMSAHINNVQDSIVALETLVGVTSSAVTSTVQYQLANTVYPARSGDLMMTSSTVVPTGWTDVSATYNNSFIRISSGTALSTGGSNTHTHTGSTDGHQLTVAEMPAHTHDFTVYSTGGGNLVERAQNAGPTYTQTTASTGGDGSHSHTYTTASANNIPVYVQTLMYKKS